MPTVHKNIIHVKAKVAPVVELDSAAHAAYIRFSKNKVSRTVVVDVDHCLVTMDVDKDGEVIGIELAGIAEFGVEELLRKARIEGISPEMLRRTRYVPANREPVAV